MTTKEQESSIRATSLSLVGNSSDPESSGWIWGVVPDEHYAEHEALYGPEIDPTITARRRAAVWTFRQYRDNGNRLTYVEAATVQAFALGTISLEDFERLTGPWYGEYEGPGRPRRKSDKKR